jgi:1A family penicillin-binding protein
MSDTPYDTDRQPSSSDARHPREPAKHVSRSGAAGRQFLAALGGDAVGLTREAAGAVARSWARLRRSLIAEFNRRAERPRLAPLAAIRPRLRNTTWAGASGRVLRSFAVLIALVGVGGALAVAGAMVWALNGLALEPPAPDSDKPSLLVEAANGAPLGRVGPLRTADAPLTDFPPQLIKAVVSIEDHRFFRHVGVDPLGILRAAHRNAEAGGIAEGGSTITQQLVKMRYVGRDRTYRRKLREALTAIWLETHLGKEEILDRYLNSIYLGAGAYGMTAAARLYFNKAPKDLTLAEAAMLAGLIKAPSQFNPLGHLEAAQARAATVLDAMVANDAIDAKAAAAAKAAPATPKLAPQLAPAATWFADWIGTKASSVPGANAGSVRVRTTLMPELQRLAQDILERTLARDGARMGASQGAIVAMRPDGAVLAMVGGRDYRASQFNRAVDAMRQPGSSFKLFVYLAALRKGYSPWDTIDASAVDINGWEPENYGNASYGRMTLADAFARSVNTAAVHLAMDVGLKNVIATARDLGIDTPLPPLPSMALGAVGVNLLEMTSAFASVRADRLHVQPWGIAAVGGQNGAPMQAVTPPAPTQSLGPAREPMIELLRGVVEHGTGRGAALNGSFAAGKTGTSQDYRDAWFIGFNDTLVVGVWLGNDDNSSMKRVTGGSLPAAIWKQFMTAATPLVAQQDTTVAAANPAPNATPNAVPSADSAPPALAPAEQPSGACDQQACAGVYSSFRTSDCTYQPYWGGGRRLCPIGARPTGPVAQTAQPPTQETSGAGAPAQTAPQCNLDACARFYSSFNPADCTYQPFGGGARQFCTR